MIMDNSSVLAKKKKKSMSEGTVVHRMAALLKGVPLLDITS